MTPPPLFATAPHKPTMSKKLRFENGEVRDADQDEDDEEDDE